MRWLIPAALGLMLSFAAGCSTTDGFTLFKNRDYADPTDGADDPWVSQAGEEGRQGRSKESSGEPRWFREVTMSDRARDIENNLGITD